VARYPLGQPLRLSTTTKQINIDGSYSLANATTLALLVSKPDATQQTYSSPANDGTGLYHQDIPAADLTQAGHYQYTWTSTGTAAGVSFGDFDVFDALAEAALLPLQDCKDMLNIPQSNTTVDGELLSFIATVETSLEGFTGGPIVNRTVVERAELDGTQTVLQVRQRPLVSVTSIVSVASGQPLDLTGGLDIDVNAGTIRRKLAWPFYGPYFAWLPSMTVTYVAGWGTSVPAAFNTCARIIVAHLWETQHGPSARPSMGGMDLTQPPGFSYAIPNRAAELLNGTVNGMPLRLEAFI
jgi:hypothetical protein